MTSSSRIDYLKEKIPKILFRCSDETHSISELSQVASHTFWLPSYVEDGEA